MAEKLNEILGSLSDLLRSEVKTETVIGKEFQLGEFKCVPVIGVGLGYGAGGGEGTDPKRGPGSGMGGGAGLGMAPVGFLVTRGEMIQFIPAKSPSGLGAALEKIPDVVEKFMEKNKTGAEK